MKKAQRSYVCQECGTIHLKWSGKCEGCGSWNRLQEEAETAGPKGTIKAKNYKGLEFTSLDGPTELKGRIMTGLDEFDRVCGGGLVPGSVMLLGGDPGIGKSTILLQLVAQLSQIHPCAYISGEEGVEQLRLRATRLGVSSAPVRLASGTHLGEIMAALEAAPELKVVIIDSIQTLYADTMDAAPGTVTQVRLCALQLIQYAKKTGTIIILVGHVTKEGTIAGPRVLEHMVDAVVYFEGERTQQFRILRGVKNRFGPTDEIGVFEMLNQGLTQVTNPSALFLSDRHSAVSGAAVFCSIEGSRPLLVEIQALVAPTSLAAPRRTAVGWDHGRLSMILAVLETRCRLAFSQRDVFLNVTGGFRVQEPGADLAVAAALISSMLNVPLPADMVFFGELGLTGEIRPVSHTHQRLKEASKLGFGRAIIAQSAKNKGTPDDGIAVTSLKTIHDLVDFMRRDEAA